MTNPVHSLPKPKIWVLATSIALLCAGSAIITAQASQSDEDTPISLGKAIFSDASLSASGKMSCASCHVPENAHAQSNDLAVQLGGAALDVPGFRAVPSLRYLAFTPAFHFDREGTPIGGFNRDGRAASLQTQAMRPFFAPHEMANSSLAELALKLQSAPYADRFKRVYGADVFDDPEIAVNRALFSIAQYEKLDPVFSPFDSKFDYFLRGQVQLSPEELRGYAWFNRADKGNCAACHSSTKSADGTPPLFTDFSYDNLGIPRNLKIPATADSGYFDLGLCGPDRSDLSQRLDLCGAFKVPTLRNIATRKVFGHNGHAASLAQVIYFYTHRDINPEQFYPLDSAHTPQKFNDLPQQYRGNVNTSEVPYDRRIGDSPRLTDVEIAEIAAFLNTLTDGYDRATNTADPARNITR